MNREDVEALILELRRRTHLVVTLEELHALPVGSTGYFNGRISNGDARKCENAEWAIENGPLYPKRPDESWLPFTLWQSGDLLERAARALEVLTLEDE